MSVVSPTSRHVRGLAALLVGLLIGLAGALALSSDAAAQQPQDAGGLQLRFADEWVVWADWRPAATASDLWNAHRDDLASAGIHVLWKLHDEGWRNYAEDASGRPIPGAVDFAVADSRPLWSNRGVVVARILIADGPYAGLLHWRGTLGSPDAPIVLIEYGDFL